MIYYIMIRFTIHVSILHFSKYYIDSTFLEYIVLFRQSFFIVSDSIDLYIRSKCTKISRFFYTMFIHFCYDIQYDMKFINEEKYIFDCHSHQTVCNYMLVKEYRELFCKYFIKIRIRSTVVDGRIYNCIKITIRNGKVIRFLAMIFILERQILKTVHQVCQF